MGGSTAADQAQGTCLVVGAALVFALVAMVVKVDPLPLLPATECRFLVSWAVSVAFMLAFRRERGLHWFGPPELRGALLLKCALSFAFITLWWAALRRAPVGDCIAIIYSSPILTSLWSRALLGEVLPREFALQTLLVTFGVVLVLDPPLLRRYLLGQAPVSSHAVESQEYTLVLCALVFCSLVPVATRRVRSCSWIEVEHVSACLASSVLDPSLLAAQYVVYGIVPELPASTDSAWQGALIVLAALGSFLGIAMETKGYQLAEAGKASMFRYVEVPFAYFLQVVVTGQPVSSRAAVGSTLILTSCALGLMSQQAHAKAAEGAESKLPLLAAAEAGKAPGAGAAAPPAAVAA